MLNDIALIVASIRNWWFNLRLDNKTILFAIVIAIVAAVLVSRLIKPPKT